MIFLQLFWYLLDMLALEHFEKEETLDLICCYLTTPCTALKNDHTCG